MALRRCFLQPSVHDDRGCRRGCRRGDYYAFTTEKYLREVTLPAVERGLAKAGRSRDDFQVVYPGLL